MSDRIVNRELTEDDALDAETAAYTLGEADENATLLLNSAGAATVTVPKDAVPATVEGQATGYTFPTGNVTRLVQQGAGRVTLAPAAGVTIHARVGLITTAQYGVAFVLKVAANSWIAWGDLAAT